MKDQNHRKPTIKKSYYYIVNDFFFLFWYFLACQTSEHLQPAVRLPAEVASRLGGRANLPALRQRQLRPPADAEGQERVRRQPGGVCLW